MPAATRDIAADITATIIARLEAGTAPWQRPWSLIAEGGRPLRHEGSTYNGINALWLWAVGDMHGFRSRYWMTARQARELGGEVRPDARPSYSVYASTFRKAGVPSLLGMSADRMIRFLRSYEVFNADEIMGLPDYYYPQAVAPTPLLLSDRQDRIDAFFAAIPSKVRHGGGAAFFDLTFDYIQMPRPGSFKSADAYASTLAHELCHASGHVDRLARPTLISTKREDYAREELAELGAAFISATIGIKLHDREDHAAYLASWLQALRNDKRCIFTAARLAQDASDWLLSRMAVETASEMEEAA